MKSSMAPSFQLSLSIDKKYHRNRFDMRAKMMSPWKANMFIVRGEPTSIGMKKVTPRTKVMLMKPLPMMLAKPSAVCPFRNARTVRDISGRLVPNAIMVAPMRVLGMPLVSAIATAD